VVSKYLENVKKTINQLQQYWQQGSEQGNIAMAQQ